MGGTGLLEEINLKSLPTGQIDLAGKALQGSILRLGFLSNLPNLIKIRDDVFSQTNDTVNDRSETKFELSA